MGIFFEWRSQEKVPGSHKGPGTFLLEENGVSLKTLWVCYVKMPFCVWL